MATQGDSNTMTLEDIEAAICTHLNKLDEDSNFDRWLACNQALLQVYQVQLLQEIVETLRRL